ILVAAISICFIATITNAQVPPAGKYNTTNYLKDRKEIALLNAIRDSSKYLNDDYISVGAEGRVYYGKSEEDKSFNKYGLKFKSVTPVKGTEVLRVYNGNAALHNVVYNVLFSSSKGDLHVKVIRSTAYIKENGKWYIAFGQGTEVHTDAEMEAAMQKNLKKKFE
ncbi:MAG: hypothetical protein H7101_12430, partial [Deinococcales bacterium]|nr:hypothetical protein [Chitinophagaceae bacterium]